MLIRKIVLFSAALLLVGCSSSQVQLTSGGSRVEFREGKPDSNCQLIGEARGAQSNWLSGDQPESVSMRHAANDLRNNAATMGGNVIYNAGVIDKSRWSDFAPLASEMVGQVYQCR